MPQHLRTTLLLTSLVLAMTPLTSKAAEIAGMDVLLAGKHICGFAYTYDGESEAEIWRMVKTQPLTFERDFDVPADPANPRTAPLQRP